MQAKRQIIPFTRPETKREKGGKFYNTYNFIDKDPVIAEVAEIIRRENVTYSYIEQASGVTSQTLRNWFFGPTRRPSNATVRAVMGAMGYKAKWTKSS